MPQRIDQLLLSFDYHAVVKKKILVTFFRSTALLARKSAADTRNTSHLTRDIHGLILMLSALSVQILSLRNVTRNILVIWRFGSFHTDNPACRPQLSAVACLDVY